MRRPFQRRAVPQFPPFTYWPQRPSYLVSFARHVRCRQIACGGQDNYPGLPLQHAFGKGVQVSQAFELVLGTSMHEQHQPLDFTAATRVHLELNLSWIISKTGRTRLNHSLAHPSKCWMAHVVVVAASRTDECGAGEDCSCYFGLACSI